jgi:3-deoxy-manno-octulosonate cytidylyltransferase (CMP-KDO synthetase)
MFTVLIPARLGSTRLPDKPLADIAGKPMVVRVALQAQASGAQRVVIAADDPRIVEASVAHGITAILTRRDHASGSDRLAEACLLLGLDGVDRVVNVQGDEPLIDPSLIRRCADLLDERPDCAMSTVAHPLDSVDDYLNPNVVKVVVDRLDRALLFSRAPLPWWRDGAAAGPMRLPPLAPLRHLGIYGYRAAFLRSFPRLAPSPLEQVEALEQLRALWHGERIAVHVTALNPGPGVDTPQDLERVRAAFRQGQTQGATSA